MRLHHICIPGWTRGYRDTPSQSHAVSVIGLGYVGLPLAVAFGRHLRTIGYDSDDRKIEAFKRRIDPTGEVSDEETSSATHLVFTRSPEAVSQADFVIIAVPTPIDHARQPDLSPLRAASDTVGRHMKNGAVVIFESTVFPGATEEVCVPLLEAASGMTSLSSAAGPDLRLHERAT